MSDMSPTEFQASVLAFLDQFITRGAAPDILDLRERVTNDPATEQRLQAQLPNPNPTEREAFDAMTAFFKGEWEAGGERSFFESGQPDLIDLMAWTAWEPGAGKVDKTEDPAQWHDWLAAVERVRGA